MADTDRVVPEQNDQGLREEAERLNRFIANLLDMIRLESGAIEPHIGPADPTQLVGGALERAAGAVARLDRALAAHPEIPFAGATTGTTNLAASALFRDTRDLYAYLTTRLADLPGLQSVESAPIIGTFKRTARTEPA